MENHTTENVKKYMKMIEELTSKGDYSDFEVALLISERSSLTHKEISDELVNEVREISDSCDTLFSDYINDELQDIGLSLSNGYDIDSNEPDITDDFEPEI